MEVHTFIVRGEEECTLCNKSSITESIKTHNTINVLGTSLYVTLHLTYYLSETKCERLGTYAHSYIKVVCKTSCKDVHFYITSCLYPQPN